MRRGLAYIITLMAIECSYSFRDLYVAAHKKEPEPGELPALYALLQEERNNIVRGWARQAGWEVKERHANDGVTYLAFAPSFKDQEISCQTSR